MPGHINSWIHKLIGKKKKQQQQHLILDRKRAKIGILDRGLWKAEGGEGGINSRNEELNRKTPWGKLLFPRTSETV